MAGVYESRDLTEIAAPGSARLEERISNIAVTLSRWFPYLYLVTAGALVVALCFINPAFEVPDEPHHFFKACQISYLDFRPHFQPGMWGAGATLPVAVNDFVVDQLSPQFRSGNILSPSDRFAMIRAKARTQQSLDKFGFIPFPDEMIYNPAYYLPQAAGIALARLFSPHVYTWFYCARVVNALCAIFLVFFALVLSRAQQVVLASVAILPMCLSQMASISPDACLFGAIILFVSLCLRSRERGGLLVEIACVALGTWLIMGRPVLFPAAVLPLIARKRIGLRKALSLCVALLALAGGISLLWASQVTSVYPALATAWHSDGSRQIRYLESQPFHFPFVVANTVATYHSALAKQSVGVLGWLNLSFPSWYYEFYADVSLLVLLFFLSLRRIFSLSGLIVIGAALAVVGAVFVSIYILFSPPESQLVQNLQGRYFTPVFAFAAMLCHNEIRQRASQYLGGLALWVLLASVTLPLTAKSIEARYYVPVKPFCTVLPRGSVDEPSAGAVVGNQLALRGWVAAPEHIEQVSIFVDGSLKESLAPDTSRADANDAVPNSPDTNKGWNGTLDISNLSPGKHEIVIQARTATGCEGTLSDFEIITNVKR